MLAIQFQASWAAKQGETKFMLYLAEKHTKTVAANTVTYIREPMKQRKISPDLTQITKHALQYSEEGFQFKTDCLFCSKQVTLGWKRTKQEQAHKVMTIKLEDALLESDMMVCNIL